MFQKPILFLIFNRPDTTRIVFNKIKELKPKYLFVSADGPRSNKPEENNMCLNARNIINDIDWDCELQTNFYDTNLGCKKGVSSGIEWFFNNVEEGIILEDDCLPDISFFNFCEVLLEKFRHDTRVMHIGGSNFQDGKIRSDGSYYFSKISHIWGWATWKRAWNKYDVDVSTLPEFIKQNKIKNIYNNVKMEKYFIRDFELVYKNQKDTWDYQWTYTLAVNNGLAIIPNKNLVSNIGFGSNATHTIFHSNLLENRIVESLNEIIHPKFLVPDFEADIYTFRKYMHINKFRKLLHLLSLEL